MHEKILRRVASLVPPRYDTPSLIECSKAVSGMVVNAKQGRGLLGSGGGRGRKKLEESYPVLKLLRVEFDALGGAMMPAAGEQWVRAHADGWPDGLEPAACRRCVSAWRKAARQEVLAGAEDGDDNE
jgi:hypothetical protein